MLGEFAFLMLSKLQNLGNEVATILAGNIRIQGISRRKLKYNRTIKSFNVRKSFRHLFDTRLRVEDHLQGCT